MNASRNPDSVGSSYRHNHRFGWIDVYDESTPEDLDRYRDAVALAISIDGDEIDDPGQHWGEPHRNDDGNWLLPWSCVTQPAPVGVHEFAVEFSYPGGYDDGGEVREPGVREPWTGYYEVVPKRLARFRRQHTHESERARRGQRGLRP